MSDWDQTFTPTAPMFLPHRTPKFLVSKGKKNTSTKKTKFSNRFGWVFKVPSLTSIKSPLHLLNKSEKEKEKPLLEDEVDHLKCAFSVHQESECNVQNCLGTDHWDNESSPSALSSGSLQTFPHPWWAPLTQAPGEGAAQVGDKCTEGHSTFWACSSFSTQAKGNPSLVLKLSQGLQMHHHSPSLQTLHSHPQTARKLCLKCLFLNYHLPVSRSTKDLKLFPILSWISAESSGKKKKK